MTSPDQFMEKAKSVVAEMMKGDNPQKPMAPFIAAALQAQDQEARKSERERAAALIEACTSTFERCDIENDWTGMLDTLRSAILSEAERTA